MRLITGILSLFFLMLTVLPCSALESSVPATSSSHASEQTAKKEVPGKHHNSNEDGLFANCHHCTVFHIPGKPDFVCEDVVRGYLQKRIPRPDHLSRSQYIRKIWQPPDQLFS